MEIVNWLFWLLPVGFIVTIIYHFNYKLPSTDPTISDYGKTKSKLKPIQYIFYGFLGSLLLLGVNKLLGKSDNNASLDSNDNMDYHDSDYYNALREAMAAEEGFEKKENSSITIRELLEMIKYGDDHMAEILYEKGVKSISQKEGNRTITLYNFKNKDLDSNQVVENQVWIYSDKKKFIFYAIKDRDDYKTFFEKVEKKSDGRFRNLDRYENYRDFIELGDEAYKIYMQYDGIIFVKKGFVFENSAYMVHIFDENLLKFKKR